MVCYMELVQSFQVKGVCLVARTLFIASSSSNSSRTAPNLDYGHVSEDMTINNITNMISFTCISAQELKHKRLNDYKS